MRIFLIISLLFCIKANAQTSDFNQRIIDTAVFYGRTISPTYYSAVCTEYVIGVLGHFITLDSADISNIRIDQPRAGMEEVYTQIENGSPEPKGVYYALIQKGVGMPIDEWTQVKRGDFVQFWYDRSWGHCGIVDSIDVQKRTMWIHSSFPSTDGYGVQVFQIPNYTWFVRLTKIDESTSNPKEMEKSEKPMVITESAPSNEKHRKRKKKNNTKSTGT